MNRRRVGAGNEKVGSEGLPLRSANRAERRAGRPGCPSEAHRQNGADNKGIVGGWEANLLMFLHGDGRPIGSVSPCVCVCVYVRHRSLIALPLMRRICLCTTHFFGCMHVHLSRSFPSSVHRLARGLFEVWRELVLNKLLSWQNDTIWLPLRMECFLTLIPHFCFPYIIIT